LFGLLESGGHLRGLGGYANVNGNDGWDFPIISTVMFGVSAILTLLFIIIIIIIIIIAYLGLSKGYKWGKKKLKVK